MSTRLRYPVLCALALGASLGLAQEPPAAGPDTSAWPCRFCTIENGASGWLEPRIGYVSEESFRLGDYTGLDDEGLLLDLGAQWRSRDAETGGFLDVKLERLGLDSRAIGVAAGRQGAYGIGLDYDVLPHYVARDAATVFGGGATLGLPAGWTRAGSTGGMTALDASLHPVWLRQERERTALRIDVLPTRAVDLRADYRRDHIQGTGATGASFLTLATQLPRAIDQTLDRADASVAVCGGLGHAQLALNSSFFTNDHAAVAWQNPYSSPVAGATRGQLAQAPDNRAHRVSLTLASAPGPLHASAQLALGRLDQDARFLPATVNPDEAAALPRSSLDGRVDTSFGSVRAVYAFLPRTRLLADLLHDKRDNRTPVATYTQVVMDTFTGTARTNTPYGFRRDRWRLSVEDRSLPRLRLGLGVEDDARERHLYGDARTDELRYWGRVGWRPVDGSDVRVRLSHAERDGEELVAGPAAPAQNALLRSYQTADRDRDEARVDLSMGSAALTTAFNLVYARDEYPGTVIGRTGGDEFGYGADLALQPAEHWSVNAFASRHLADTDQAGSQGFGLPDWLAEQEDVTNTVGLRVDWQAPRGLKLGADYVLSTAEGSILMAAGAGESAFPLLVTRWHDARIHAGYPLRPNLALRLDLIRERYEAHDWTLDGVAPDTVRNLLWLGQGTQDADVTAVLLSVRYEIRAAPPAD